MICCTRTGHPTTVVYAVCDMQVCVPMNPGRIWSFDPDAVVTVHGLLDEERGSPKAAGAEQGMAEALQTFHGCFLDELAASSRQSIIARARSAAQAGLAW